jgi:hypothetical protein
MFFFALTLQYLFTIAHHSNQSDDNQLQPSNQPTSQLPHRELKSEKGVNMTPYFQNMGLYLEYIGSKRAAHCWFPGT